MSDEKEKPMANGSIQRHKKSENFSIISNDCVFDKPPLSLEAKGLLWQMFSLPDTWNHCINGYRSLCGVGERKIKKIFKELKDRGYLRIEKISPKFSGNGHFSYIYHIYDEKQDFEKQEVQNVALELQKQEVQIQPLENQPLQSQPLQNEPLNIKTNNEITNEVNTNNLILVNSFNEFTVKDLFELYKKMCVSFPKPTKLTEERINKAEKRIKKYPQKEFWQKVFENAENSDFCKRSKFFTFDWILTNNLNPLKVYEGNYSNKTSQNYQQSLQLKAVNGGKYNGCY